MAFWLFMLIMDLLIPITMIGFGTLFLKHAPGKINPIFGYRTKMSMKNHETWEFAHRYCGKIWYIWGWIMVPFTVIAMAAVLGRDQDTIGTVGGIVCMLQLIPLIGSIFPTENALKKTFDQDGRRK